MSIAPAGAQRKLSDVAKHLVKPDGMTGTLWGPVNRQCRRKLGIQFDGWQHGAGQLMLATHNDELAAGVGGFGMSIPRQVGKTYFVGGSLFGLCLERPASKFLWTAHHARTHGETFLAMQDFSQRPRVAPFVRRVYMGAGDEEVRFVNGSRILFGARERGFGRGIPDVDGIIFDEGQILTDKALEDMLATMNRSDLGLHCYLGTPPKPGDPCEVFERMRTEALAGARPDRPCHRTGGDLVWIECGADDDADLDDPRQWAKANPSYPHWTSDLALRRLRRKLGPDGFRREGLGIWPKLGATAFDVARWALLEDATTPAPDSVVVVVDVAEYQTRAAIGVSGEVDGKTLIMCEANPGTNWVAAEVAELVKNHDVVEVNLMPGEARGLAGDLTAAGVEYRKLSTVEVAESTSAFRRAVNKGKLVDEENGETEVALVHLGQTELDAVATTRTRKSGPGQTWEDGTDPAVRAVAAAFHRWTLQDEPMPALY